MLFLKSHKFYQTLLLTTFLSSCASRGPGYAAREELYDKLAQPEMMAKKEPAIKEVNIVSVEQVPAQVAPAPAIVETPRSISSQEVTPKAKRKAQKEKATYSKVMVDDLDLNIVPATSSSSGKGFLLND